MIVSPACLLSSCDQWMKQKALSLSESSEVIWIYCKKTLPKISLSRINNTDIRQSLDEAKWQAT